VVQPVSQPLPQRPMSRLGPVPWTDGYSVGEDSAEQTAHVHCKHTRHQANSAITPAWGLQRLKGDGELHFTFTDRCVSDQLTCQCYRLHKLATKAVLKHLLSRKVFLQYPPFTVSSESFF